MELLICLLIVVAAICMMCWVMRGGQYEGFAAKQHRYTFIKFYAPWCGFCQRLAPEWKKLKHHYAHKVAFEEYNCDVHKEQCSRHDVTGYPTIKIRDNLTKKYLSYDGPREYRAMAAWIDTVVGR